MRAKENVIAGSQVVRNSAFDVKFGSKGWRNEQC